MAFGNRGGSERKNYVIKALIIVLLFMLAMMSTVLYIYAYPKSTITLYSMCGGVKNEESSFKIKKYSTLGNVKAVDKFGYDFEYWAYDEDGYSRLDNTKEVDVDYLNLYGMYKIKNFEVRLWIQTTFENTNDDSYILHKTYPAQFNSAIELSDGKEGGILIDELRARVGYTFIGWVPKIKEQELVSPNDVTGAGNIYYVHDDVDVDLYAYWVKNEYNVIAHTGYQYQMETQTKPARDGEGNFIITNTRIQESRPIRYLDKLSVIIDNITPQLNESDGFDELSGVDYADHNEYEFVGWYLDEELTQPIEAGKLVVKVNRVDGVDIPYLEYAGDETKNQLADNSGGEFKFHIYSKWKRKSYTLSFNNHGTGVKGKLEPITIYKFDDRYGKFYQTGEFTREDALSEYFNQLDLSDPVEITTDAYMNSNNGYRFVGWSNMPDPDDSEDCKTYYRWYQNPIETGDPSSTYVDKLYTHTVSGDVVLYAQWSKIRTATFYDGSSSWLSNKKFDIRGIAGEWFKLPGSDKVVDELGWSINDYSYFAGWRQGSTAASPILAYKVGPDGEYILDASGNKILNENFTFEFPSGRQYTTSFYVYWENKKYTVKFYLNDGTTSLVQDEKLVTGGSNISFPKDPTRTNYIFDGWSKTQYADNTLDKAKIKTLRATGLETLIEIYASWIKNYTVEYNANNGTGRLPSDVTYEKIKGTGLNLCVSIGSGSQLTRSGYDFAGWLLNINGTLNTDYVILPNTEMIFNCNIANDGKYYCYKKNQSNVSTEFQLTGDDNHKVVLYANWKPRLYTISIIDTVDDNSKKTISNVPYGVDFDLSEHITEHVGYKFVYLSTSENGSADYTPGNMILPGTSIFNNYTFYAIYEKRNIKLEYVIVRADFSEINYKPSASYSSGVLAYGSELKLPSPTWSDFDDPNYKFDYWYYIDSEDQIVVKTGDKLIYEGEELTLYAKYKEQIFNTTFTFINPLNERDVIVISADAAGNPYNVKKGSLIGDTLYDDIIAQINALITERNIRQYTLKGLFSSYNGRVTQFTRNQSINDTAFPVLSQSNTINFTTEFTPNSVEFIYKSGEGADAEVENGYHVGNDYSSKSDIILENVTFSLGEGQSIKQWYIVDSSGEKVPFAQGDQLIGPRAQFTCVADLDDYIKWTYDEGEGKYRGIISIYAETQQTFTIEYFVFKDGAITRISDYNDEHVYSESDSNIVTARSGDKAIYNNVKFNGWMVYNSRGLVTTVGNNGLVNDTFELDPETFPDYKVKLYADLSYYVQYNILSQQGNDFIIQELMLEEHPLISRPTADYRDANNYITLHKIDTKVDMGEVPSGYEYYGYKIGDNLYTDSQINNTFDVAVNGETIVVLCYLTKTININYEISGDESFEDGSTGIKTYTYVLGYDNSVVAERVSGVDQAISAITIKSLVAKKPGHYFNGWSIKGQVGSYTINQEIILSDNTTFIPVFKEPEQGTISAIIRYVYNDGTNNNLFYEVQVNNINGSIYTLLDVDDSRLDYVSAKVDPQTKGIVGWKYDSQIVTQINIPLLITEGQLFTIYAEVKDKYTIIFTTYSQDTVDNVVIFADTDPVQLTKTPTLDEGKTFLYWEYDLSSDPTYCNPVHINANDAIVFTSAGSYSCLDYIKGGKVHYLPVKNGEYTYNFYAVGEDITIILVVGLADGDVSYQLKDVKYGSSFTARELVDIVLNAGIGVQEYNNSGIVAWTGEEYKDERLMSYYNTSELQQYLVDNITNISINKTLYAVWQSKYILSYATETDGFGYRDETGNPVTHSDEYYFAGEVVEFNANVIKSIYYKGYNTVYFDNGNYIVYVDGVSNDYYVVSGFGVTDVGGTTQEYLFTNASTFTMPGSNAVITPLDKKVVYQVKFDKNISEDENTINTIYVDSLADVELNNYTAQRSNFTFIGWNTDKDAEVGLSNIASLPNSNITLYAIWSSNLSASFQVNGQTIFSIPFTRTSQINQEILNSYLSMNGREENGFFNNINLNGNSRTYSYNNINYYLNSFSYGGANYKTTAELCSIELDELDSGIVVSILLNNIYTIRYTQLDQYSEPIEIQDIPNDYIVDNKTSYGRISSTSNTDTFVLANYEVESLTYYEYKSWMEEKSHTVYEFGSSTDNTALATLVSNANTDRVITLILNQTPKSFRVVLNSVDNPQEVYSTFANADDVKTYNGWTDVASVWMKDSTGNTIVPSGDVYLTYLNSFIITFPENATNHYKIIGWSKTPYRLGDTGNNAEDIYYCLDYKNNNGNYTSGSLTLDENMLGEDSALVLYPVYEQEYSHLVQITVEGGRYTYTITTNDQLTGYMCDPDNLAGVQIASSGVVNLAYYHMFELEANVPNANFELKELKYNDTDIVGTNLEIDGSVDCVNCTHSIDIVYSPKEINVTAKLLYTQDLISGQDASTIVLDTTTLSYTNYTATLILLANASVNVSSQISQYFDIDSIKSGDKTIRINNDKFAVSDLEVDAENNAEIVFTLAPKSYNVTFNLQGGSLAGFSYSSEQFGDHDVTLNNNTAKVVAGASISVPTPTKEKCEFSYFMVNGVRYDTLDSFAVTCDLTITAYFIQNQYTITYNFNNGGIYQAYFVGGSTIIIGDGTIGFEEAGIDHIGWQLKDTADVYYDGQNFTTNKKDYIFDEVVKGADVKVEFFVKNGESLTGLTHKQTNANYINIEYGKKFEIPSESEFTDATIANKGLYGWTLTEDGTGDIIIVGSNVSIYINGDIEYEYPTEGEAKVTLYAVYYNNYSYTFAYTNTGETTIVSSTHNITAINSDGSVNVDDLRFTINNSIPVNEDDTLVFAGYKVLINGADSGTTINAGETITLVDPKDYAYANTYAYTFEAIYQQASGAAEIKVFITNASNPIETLNVNIGGSEFPYYSIYTFLNNNFQASSLPVFDYSTLSVIAEWKLSGSDNVLFTTNNTNLIAYKILGYNCTILGESGNLIDEIEILFTNINGYNLAGGTTYELTPIWENRYSVSYYDIDGANISTTYYDVGTKLNVDNDIDKYNKDGYKFVGYTDSHNKEILSTSDYILFNTSYEITNSNYNFYPAFSRIYSVTINDNGDILDENLGDKTKIDAAYNDLSEVYVGMPAVTLNKYLYNDIGYSCVGFTLISEKMANDLSAGQIFTKFTFNEYSADKLNIYVAWQRAEVKIKFKLTARKNNAVRSYVDNEDLELTYLFNESVDFEAEAIREKVESLFNTFELKSYSLTEDGATITEHVAKVVDDSEVIYVNYYPKITIVYNLGNANYNNEDTPRLPEDDPQIVLNQSADESTRTLIGYDAKNNLYKADQADLYWSLQGSADRFFDNNNKHIFTLSDLNYADENYVINLYIFGDVARYDVNLYFFNGIADLEGYYESPSDTYYKVVTTQIPCLTENIFEIVFDEVKQEYRYTSTYFDPILSSNYETTLHDILMQFVDKGYKFDGIINVNDSSNEMNLVDYVVNQYTGDVAAYTNNIYLVYELIEYSLDMYSMVIEDKDNISPVNGYSEEAIYTAFEIDGENTVSLNAFTYNPVTIKSEINLIYKDDIAKLYSQTNLSYEFVGFYSPIYSGVQLIGFGDVYEGDNWSACTIEVREDGLYGGYNKIYTISGNVVVYALFVEKAINVTVTYASPDKCADDVSAEIYLNNNILTDDKFTITSSTDEQKVFTFKALYNQYLYVTSAASEYYQIKYFKLGGIKLDATEFSTILVSQSGELTEYSFEVVFESKRIDVYVRTNAGNIGANTVYAELTSVDVTTYLGDNYMVSGSDIYEENTLNENDSLYYNYIVRVPYNSTINAINAHLNNFTIKGWKNNGTNFTTPTITESTFINIDIEANAVNVKYYASDGVTEIPTETVLGQSQTNIKYGSRISLPYIVVDEGNKVSTGWNIDGSNYNWGNYVFVLSANNTELVDNTFKIVTTVINKYYVIFDNDTGLTFDIPSQYKTKNNDVVVAADQVNMTFNGTGENVFYHYTVSTESLIENTVEFNSITVYNNQLTIPETLQFTTNSMFGGWISYSNNKFTNLYTYNSNDITNVAENEILLKTSTSGIVGVRFYLTNPTAPADETKDFTFATSANVDADYTIPYIQLFYDKEKQQLTRYVNISNTHENFIEWSSGYFMIDNMNLLEDYTFYGWSTDRRSVLNSPKAMYTNLTTNSSLLYKWIGDSRVANTLQTNIDSLLALLKNENYVFYSVWEKNKTITFDAQDNTYTNGFSISGKYSEGSEIPLPNNLSSRSGVYKDLQNGSNKWIGWESEDKALNYFFDEMGENYKIYAPSKDCTFKPLWKKGTSVYFDINFDGVRQYFAEAFHSKVGGSVDLILSNVGYPYVLGSVYTYTPHETIQGQRYSGSYQTYTYTKIYKEGDFWAAGSQVPVYKYIDSVFGQKGIFTEYADLDKYFDLLGWYYDINNNNKYDNGELITSEDQSGRLVFNLTEELINLASDSITLHAYWKPVDLEVEFYYSKDAAEQQDHSQQYGKTIDETYTQIVISVPFGYKLTSNQAYETAGGITYLYSDIASDMTSPAIKTVPNSQVQFYRFSHWSDYTNINATNIFNNVQAGQYLANTISDAIINHTRLYPVYRTQYVVRFIDSSSKIISSDINQYVITGEDIIVKEALAQVQNINIISDVYYINNVSNVVSLMSGSNIKESITFNEAKFFIIDNYYINIYVDLNIVIRAYIPDYSDVNNPSRSQYKNDVTIFQGNNYIIREHFPMTDQDLNTIYGDTVNYPSFGGWYLGGFNSDKYYSNVISDAYRIDGNGINTIKVISETSGNITSYYVVINGDMDNKTELEVQGDGVYVCLYAKLYTTTTVSLGESSDYEILNFATLSYGNIADNDVRYTIINEQKTGNLLKSVSYLSVYYSPYAPTFNVVLNYGYRIKSISNINSSRMNDLINESNISKSSDLSVYTDSKFTAIITKTTTTETDLNNMDQMRLKYTIEIGKVLKTNNLKFNISIEAITYTINYIYDNTITSPLVYRTSNSATATWQAFEQESTSDIEFNSDTFIYDNATIRNKFKVKYTSTSNEITIENVPYGASLYIGAFASDLLMYHFDCWEVSVTGMPQGASIGVMLEYEQAFYPVLYDNNGYITELNVEAIMQLNVVQSITYQLRFNEDRYDIDSAWHNLLKSDGLNGQLTFVNSSDGAYYLYTWTPKGTLNGKLSDSTILAGDDITVLLNTIKQKYDEEFNSEISVIENNGITKMSQLLNYFWFNALWYTYQSDKDNNICSLEQNIIKVNENGNVTLYTLLDKAVLVKVEHQIRDYLNDENIVVDDNGERIDRADVKINSIKYQINGGSEQTGIQGTDYYLIGDNNKIDTNYEQIAVKMPYGYTLNVTMIPEGANDSHVAYRPYGWTLINGESKNPIMKDIIDPKLSMETSSYGDYYFVEGRPEFDLLADVMAVTYDLILYNSDGNQIGKNIEIAYDSYIADKSPSTSNYDYSLQTLRENNNLYLFILDEKANGDVVKFNHPSNSKDSFGKCEYLFNFWSLTNGGDVYDQGVVIKSYVSGSNKYENIELYACYYQNTQIDYTVLSDVVGNSTSYTYYLPERDLIDQFGNCYPDNLMISPALYNLQDWGYIYNITQDNDRFNQAIVDCNNSGQLYAGTPNPTTTGDYNVSEDYNGNYIHVTSVSDLVELNTTSFTSNGRTAYRVYPAIDYNLTIKENGISKANGDYIVRTFGGRYAVSMLDNGKIKFINVINLYQGSVSEDNIVTNGVISPSKISGKQFAYWEVYKTDPTAIGNVLLAHNLASNPYCINEAVTIDNHYNVKVEFLKNDNNGNGEVVVVNNENNTTAEFINNLSITIGNIGVEPSKVYLSNAGLGIEDEDIKIQRIAIERLAGNKIAIIDYTDKSNPVLGYTAEYQNAQMQAARLYWKITFANNQSVLILKEEGELHYIEDSWGNITIMSMVFPPEVTINIEEGFYISNVSDGFNSRMSSLIKLETAGSNIPEPFTVESGSELIFDTNIQFNNSSNWNTCLKFKPLTTGTILDYYIKAVVYSGGNSTDKISLANYTHNYRWEYYYDNEWRTVVDGGAYADGNGGSSEMLIRLACDWKTINVNFLTFYNLNLNNFNNDSVNGFNITNAFFNTLDGRGFKVGDSGVLQNTSVELLMGDYGTTTSNANQGQVIYDVDNESFKLTNYGNQQFSSDLQITSVVPTEVFMQGWFQLSLDNGKYSIGAINKDIFKDENLIFILWLEKKVTRSVVVDRSEQDDIVNGLGKVNITAQNVKSNKVFEVELKTTNNYLSDYKMGVSTILKIETLDHSTYDHKFVQMSYDKNSGESCTITSLEMGGNSYYTFNAGDLGSNIKVLYDASDTKTQYIITDELLNVRCSTYIYGGYYINYEYTTNNKKCGVDIYSYWGEIVNHYEVLYQTNGTSDIKNIYPRYNFHITNLHLSQSTTDFQINVDQNGNRWVANYSLPQTYGSKVISTGLNNTSIYEHVGDNAKTDNNILVFMDEDLHTADLNIMIQLEGGVNGTQYTNYLDESQALMDTSILTSNYDKTTSTNALSHINKLRIGKLLKTSQFGIYYDISQGMCGMMLGVYDSESDHDPKDITMFRNNPQHKLKGLDIYAKLSTSGVTATDIPLVTNDYYDRANDSVSDFKGKVERLSDLLLPEYTLVIRVEVVTEVNIAFMLTLPYASDLSNLNMTTNLLNKGVQFETGKPAYYAVQDYAGVNNIVNPITFNRLNGNILQPGDTTNSELIHTELGEKGFQVEQSLTIDKGAGSSISVSIYNGDLIFSNNRLQIGYIRYTLPKIFDYMGNNTGLGWYIVSEQSNYTMKRTTINDGKVSYMAWETVDDLMTPIGSSKITLPTDSIIILALKRKPVTIYVEDGTWWSDINDENLYSLKDNEKNKVQNQDDSFITYAHMQENGCFSSDGVEELIVPGGLAVAVPTDYDTSKEHAYQVANGYSEPRKLMSINNTIRSGVKLLLSDGDSYKKFNSLVAGTPDNTKVINYADNFKSKKGVVGVTRIVAEGEVEFNVELTNSTSWAFVTIPSSDLGVTNSEYTSVTMYSNNEDNVDLNPVIGTFNFVRDKITLMQSYVTWTDDDYEKYDARQQTFSIFIAKESNTGLYHGMYVDLDGFRPEGNTYSRIKFSYNTDMTIDTPDTEPNARIMLSSYRVVDINNTSNVKVVKYEDFRSGMYQLDLSEFTSKQLAIYPIWEKRNVYTVTIVDGFNKLANTGTFRLLEGNSLNIQYNLSSTATITNQVSQTSVSTSSTYKVINVEYNNKDYIFSGFSTRQNTNYGTGKDSDYDKYGFLRITENSGTYKLDYGKNRTADGNNYTIKLTAPIGGGTGIDGNITLYAVWIQYGYEICYKFNDKVYMGNSGTTYDPTEYSLKPEYNNKSDLNCNDFVEYATYLVGMPFKVGEDINYSTIGTYSKYKASAFDIYDFYEGTSGTASIESKLMNYKNNILIGFSLVHNKGHEKTGGCLVKDDKTYKKSCCSIGKHGYDSYNIYRCPFCSYDMNSDYSYTKYGTYYEYEILYEKILWKVLSITDGRFHNKIKKCNNCSSSLNSEIKVHTWIEIERVEPTCSEEGYILYKCCSKDGDKIDENGGCCHTKKSTLEKLDHNYGTKIYRDTSKNCTQDGWQYYKCKDCGHKKNITANSSHDWSSKTHIWGKKCSASDAFAQTCSRCGKTQKVSGSCKYSWSEYTTHHEKYSNPDPWHCSREDTYVKFPCTTCGMTYRQYNNKEYKIRIRVSQIKEHKDNRGLYCFTRDSLEDSNSNYVHHNSNTWSLFNYYCSCGADVDTFDNKKNVNWGTSNSPDGNYAAILEFNYTVKHGSLSNGNGIGWGNNDDDKEYLYQRFTWKEKIERYGPDVYLRGKKRKDDGTYSTTGLKIRISYVNTINPPCYGGFEGFFATTYQGRDERPPLMSEWDFFIFAKELSIQYGYIYY